MDPIPWIPGNIDFFVDIIKNLTKDTVAHNMASRFWLQGIAMELILHKLKGCFLGRKVDMFCNTYFPIAQKYQHIQKIVYYASADVSLKAYIDNIKGNNILTFNMLLPDFVDISFAPVEKYVIYKVTYNHMFIMIGRLLWFNPS